MQDALYLMQTRGWFQFEACLSPAQISQLNEDVLKAYGIRREVQIKNGVSHSMGGTAHHTLGAGDSLDDFINHLPLIEVIKAHFAGQVILLNFGATLNQPGEKPYTHKIHRDIRAFSPDYFLSLNMLVMLDDFTLENGATKVLEGSHHIQAMPSETLFDSHATSLTGKAGDIVLFNSSLAHKGAPNQSSGPRRALTLCFGRPFMKPQMDWQSFIPLETQAHLTPLGRQLLGFNARMPKNLDEYYQPMDNWTFKADQI